MCSSRIRRRHLNWPRRDRVAQPRDNTAQRSVRVRDEKGGRRVLSTAPWSGRSERATAEMRKTTNCHAYLPRHSRPKNIVLIQALSRKLTVFVPTRPFPLECRGRTRTRLALPLCAGKQRVSRKGLSLTRCGLARRKGIPSCSQVSLLDLRDTLSLALPRSRGSPTGAQRRGVRGCPRATGTGGDARKMEAVRVEY